MNKYLKLLIVAAIVTAAVSGFAYSQPTGKTTLQELKLKGNVKSVSETSYKAVTKSGVIQKGKRKREGGDNERDFHTVFNTHGNQAEKILYNTDSSVFRKVTYQYDD